MKYYKLIKDGTFVGVVSSQDFIYYSLISHSFLRCNELLGEYISFQGKIYRATWMHNVEHIIPYIEVQALEIDKEEYEIYNYAIENNEIIEEEDPEIIIPPAQVDPADISSLEFIRTSKINEMSYTCRQTIENGFDLELRGETHHFSLDTQDQLNLITLSSMAQTQEYIPYHADGEECIFYTAAEMNAIIAAATQFKIYHTTYYNALKTYINALDTIEAIAAITYGTPIPEEYQSDVLKALENE